MSEEARTESGPVAEVKHGDRTIRIDGRPRVAPPPLKWPDWYNWLLAGLLAVALWFGKPYIHPALFVVLIFACVVGGLALLVLIRLLAPPKFDLAKGEFSHGWLGFRRRRPFAELVAVQLVTDRRVTYRIGFDQRPSVRKAATSQQVNLIFADDPEPTGYTLGNFPEVGPAREYGRRIADMLGIPLVDQIVADQAEGGHATPSGPTDLPGTS